MYVTFNVSKFVGYVFWKYILSFSQTPRLSSFIRRINSTRDTVWLFAVNDAAEVIVDDGSHWSLLVFTPTEGFFNPDSLGTVNWNPTMSIIQRFKNFFRMSHWSHFQRSMHPSGQRQGLCFAPHGQVGAVSPKQAVAEKRDRYTLPLDGQRLTANSHEDHLRNVASWLWSPADYF